MDVPKTKKTGFESYFHEEQEKRKARERGLANVFSARGYWVDTDEAMGGLLSIAEEFNLTDEQLFGVWVRFPNGCTIRRPRAPSGGALYLIISQSVHKFDEFRAFLRNVQREHKERQTQADLHTSRIKPYQYPTGGVNNLNGEYSPGSHYEGFYSEHGHAGLTNLHSFRDYKLVQGRAVIDKLFDLVEHAEKAEAGRERAELSRERLLEELRGLRLELGQLSRPSRSNTDRTFYVACGCLGVLVLMLFFK